MDARIVVDASVLISQLMPLDINHTTSLFWLNRFTTLGGRLIEPVFVQIEVAGALSRLTGLSDLSKNAIEELNSSDTIDFIPFDAELVQSAIEIASNLQLRAGDAIYVAMASQLNIPLVTWDKEQLQRGGSLVATYTPESYTFLM